MPDYIYLLENRLSSDQQNALRQLREVARDAGLIHFLTGDAVRDLTSGHAVRDLEVSVHGNALKLKKEIEKRGGNIWGQSEASRSLYVCFPGTVRVDVISTHRMDFARLDKPVYHPASIQEDLRRRDFTVNAMAISLNEGSFGLLMDPLNGAADIEARTLRLVSNYGFLEEPSLLIRATRYIARLGWQLDAKTRTRYDNAKNEDVIERLSAEARSRELEQIGHEDEGLKVLRALEDEGWMKVLFPAWTTAKADEERLKALHDLAVELLMQGVHPDMSAAQMQLLTAKLSAKDLAALKHLMLRPGFVQEWNSLDAMAAKFAKVLLSKENSTASKSFKLFTSYDPEAVLWLAFTSKDKAVQDRFSLFLKVWPEARQRIPHAVMQEMRITPELATYREIVQAIFLELIDGKLSTPEEMRAFLEPHSPPAPPPREVMKRPRAKRGEAKLKERTYDDEDEESEDVLDEVEDIDDLGTDEDEIDLGLKLPAVDLEAEIGEDAESESADDGLEADEAEPVRRAAGKPKAAVAEPKPAAVPAKGKIVKGKVVPAAIPANAATGAMKKAGPAPVTRKGEKMSENVVASAAPISTASAPGVKPPQTAGAFSAQDEGLTPGVKPPQAASASALPAKPGKGASAPAVKAPQVKAKAPKAPLAKAKPTKGKPAPKAAKAAAPKKAKTAPKAVKAKASAKKAKAATKKTAPKAVKAKTKAKAKKPAPKAGKKR
jgi:tRNA nucleotidyltransferase (CCA-adding enzyme)